MLGRDYSLVGRTVNWRAGREGKAEGEFASPVAIAVNPRGDVAVVDRLNHRIQFFDGATGACRGAMGQKGGTPGDLLNPAGCAYSPEGHLAVADSSNHRIQIYEPYSRRLAASVGERGGGPRQCVSPGACCWVHGQALLVADTGNHRLLVWAAPGVTAQARAPAGRYGRRGAGRGELAFPVGVAYREGAGLAQAAAEPNLLCPPWFVGAAPRSRCGQAVAKAGKPGAFVVRDVNLDTMAIVHAPPDFEEKGEAVDVLVKIMDDKFYIKQARTDKLVGYHTLYDLLRAQTWLSLPPDHRPRGHVAVADEGNDRVQILSYCPAFSVLVPPLLDPLNEVGGPSYPLAGRLRAPSSVSYTVAGDLAVCDAGNHRVVIFAGGDYAALHWFGGEPGDPSGLGRPLAVAADPRGGRHDALLVATRECRLRRLRGPARRPCGALEGFPRAVAGRIFGYLSYWEAAEVAGCCQFLAQEMGRMRVAWELAPLNPVDLVRLKLCFVQWATKQDGTSLPKPAPIDAFGVKICDKFLATKKCDRPYCPYSHCVPELDEKYFEESGACLELDYGAYHVIMDIFGSHFWWEHREALRLLFFHYAEMRTLRYYTDPMTGGAEVIRLIEDRQAKVLTYRGYLRFVTAVFEHVMGLRDWGASPAMATAGREGAPAPAGAGLAPEVVHNRTFDYQVDKVVQALENLF